MNLSRNIGGSVGISVVTALLARNIQTNHSVLGAHIPNPGIGAADPLVTAISGASTDQVLAMADGLVNQQAAMIAVPLVLVLKRPPPAGKVEIDPGAAGH